MYRGYIGTIWPYSLLITSKFLQGSEIGNGLHMGWAFLCETARRRGGRARPQLHLARKQLKPGHSSCPVGLDYSRIL